MALTLILPAAERVLLTLWVGGLWVTGLIVAPILFGNYERLLAGEIAGRLFTAMSWLGLLCGASLLVISVVRSGRCAWRDWRAVVLLVMLIITVAGEFGFAARMRELKDLMVLEQAAAMRVEFGRLHGFASLLYLVNSVLGLVLVIFGIRPNFQAGN